MKSCCLRERNVHVGRGGKRRKVEENRGQSLQADVEASPQLKHTIVESGGWREEEEGGREKSDEV